MKLEDQVCSLELAKKLKELGVKQESLWWWEIRKRLKGEIWSSENTQVVRHKSLEGQKGIEFEYISTFTVAELGEMLPENIWLDNEFWELNISKRQDNKIYYLVRYSKRGMEALSCNLSYMTTEANARAKMLVYLLENKLVKI